MQEEETIESPPHHKVAFAREIPQDGSPKDRTPIKGRQIYIPDSRGRLKGSEASPTTTIDTDTMMDLAAYAGPVINTERHSSTATASFQNDVLCCCRSLRRKKLLAWGGPFRELMAAENYSLFDFIVNNVPFDGISSIFHIKSGWPRTIFYTVCFTVTGYFFIVVLIRPLVQQFQTRDATISYDYVTHVDGVPYPIITVCPKGNGIRCDCQLWKRLACHYRGSNLTSAFQLWTCDQFSFVGNAPGVWDRMCDETWNVSSLNWNDDPCGGTINGEDLFNGILQREQEQGKPFITMEEQVVYGAVRLDVPNINFRFLNTTYGILGQAINFKYLNYRAFDIFSGRICVQMRLPADMKQKISGTDKGIQILVTNFMDLLLPDASGCGVDVFIENNEHKRHERVYLYDHSIPGSPNEVTSIAYKIGYSQLLKGYGGEKSRTCSDEGDRRRVCVQKKDLQSFVKNCDFCTKVQYASYFGFSDNETEQFYGAFGCDIDCRDDIITPSISFTECPSRCKDVLTTIVGYYPVKQTDYQKKLYELLYGNKNIEGVTELRIGIDSFDSAVIKESPAQTLGGLIGTIGGNLNLWFGPDFMSVLWFLELIIFGSIYSRFTLSPNVVTIK